VTITTGGDMSRFLASTDIVNWHHPDVSAHARALRGELTDGVEIARRCFEWVRDEIKHSMDYGLTPVTCAASDVLREGSGFCYAKSHLLAALLRANGVRAGLCYQRLSLNDGGPPYCLHGLNAVWLQDVGWYRVDPRGNRSGVDAQYAPPVERLAFSVTAPGEADLPEIWAEPLPIVVEALRTHQTTEVKSFSSCKSLKALVSSASGYATASSFVIGIVSARNWASCRSIAAVIGIPRQSFDAAIRLA
jgi:transglutaminase-like putative cysteine protease